MAVGDDLRAQLEHPPDDITAERARIKIPLLKRLFSWIITKLKQLISTLVCLERHKTDCVDVVRPFENSSRESV